MKSVILLIVFFISLSLARAQSDQLQDLKDKKNFAIEAATAPIKTKYVADLKKLLSELIASRNWNEVKKVKEEIALIEEKASTNNSPAKVFNAGYIVGTNWEYVIGKQKYLIIFERRICNIYKIDFRGRKVLLEAEKWKIDSIEERRIIILRGSLPMAFNEDLTEMFTPIVPRGVKVKLVGK